MNFLRPKVWVSAAAVWMVTAPAMATEWFVAPGGTGNGTSAAPFGRVQEGLNAALAGDTVTVLPGKYAEAVQTVRSGSSSMPIRLRAQGARGSVILTVPGRVMRVDHAYIRVESLVLDGQYAAADTIDVNAGAHFLRLTNLEVRRSSRDLIDISS